MSCDREIQRKFNEYLKKYPYIMFDPFEVDVEDNISGGANGLYIGFTQRILNADELINSDIWVETDANESNVFYLYSPYAHVIQNFGTNKCVFISTSTFPELDIEPAPFSYAENLPVLKADNTNGFMVAVLEFINREDVTNECEEMLEDVVKRLIESNDLALDVIFEDLQYNPNNVPIGKVTTRVTYMSNVLGYIYTSGYSLHKSETYVYDLAKWNDLMQFVVDNSGVRDIINSTVKVINPTDDCDIYFAVPKYTEKVFKRGSL